LDTCPNELRGWEWRYLKGQCHGEMAELPSVAHAVVDRLPVVFSPDGNSFAALDGPGKALRLGDAETGRSDFTIALDANVRPQPAYSPDGRYLAIARADGVPVWDLTARTVVTTLT